MRIADSSYYSVEQCKKGSWEDSVRSLAAHLCLSLLPVRYASVIAICWVITSTVNPRAWEKSCVQLKVVCSERDWIFLKSVPEYTETGMYWSMVWFLWNAQKQICPEFRELVEENAQQSPSVIKEGKKQLNKTEYQMQVKNKFCKLLGSQAVWILKC